MVKKNIQNIPKALEYPRNPKNQQKISSALLIIDFFKQYANYNNNQKQFEINCDVLKFVFDLCKCHYLSNAHVQNGVKKK